MKDFLLPYPTLTSVRRYMAQLGIFFFSYMNTQDHAILSCLDPFFPTSLYPSRKAIWSELESNPGPLDSQAAALTTGPSLFGQMPDEK